MPSDKIVRPRGYGLTAQLKKKQDAKFDYDLAEDCLTWMKFVLDDGGFTEESSSLPDTVSLLLYLRLFYEFYPFTRKFLSGKELNQKFAKGL